MSFVKTLVVLVTGLAIGGAVVIAHRVSQETGKGWADSFADVPEEAQRMFDDLKARTGVAVDRGREAYHQKQSEMESYLTGGRPVE
jgi:hypothetical protein